MSPRIELFGVGPPGKENLPPQGKFQINLAKHKEHYNGRFKVMDDKIT